MIINGLSSLPGKKSWYPPLIMANAFGALYGFYWYREQLNATHWYLWPVVPDSPLAVLFFTLILVNLYRGRRNHWLEALGYIAMIKYGLWTPLVLIHAGWALGFFGFESFHLTLSHLAMALQGWLFLRKYWPPLTAFWPVLGWFLFNDFMDYVVGTHPTLPSSQSVGFAGFAAVITTIVASVLVYRKAGSK